MRFYSAIHLIRRLVFIRVSEKPQGISLRLLFLFEAMKNLSRGHVYRLTRISRLLVSSIHWLSPPLTRTVRLRFPGDPTFVT